VVQAHGVADADGIGDGPVEMETEVTDGQDDRDADCRQGHLPEVGVFIGDAVGTHEARTEERMVRRLSQSCIHRQQIGAKSVDGLHKFAERFRPAAVLHPRSPPIDREFREEQH
jgi:hypothetical protein